MTALTNLALKIISGKWQELNFMSATGYHRAWEIQNVNVFRTKEKCHAEYSTWRFSFLNELLMWRMFQRSPGFCSLFLGNGQASDAATSADVSESWAAMSAATGEFSLVFSHPGLSQRSSQRKKTLCHRIAF